MKNNTTRTARPSARGLQIRPKAAALAVAACFSSVVWANPTNPTVVHGTASFQQAGNILNVTNSHNAIINWGSFSIGVNELTRFIQPSALSAVLNRVTGQDPSAILGALQSNGRVFLLNPNGIVFGAGAQINVGGLVASTLNLSNADFLAGRMNFTDGTGAGSVLNQGSINAAGGPVYMVGNAVTNQGIITSPGGEVILAAGNSVELVNPGTPNLRVEIQAASNEARNLGSVVAEAGRIGIYAGLIKQGGVINADSAVAEGGRIMLKSTKRTDLDTTSVITARGSDGGRIDVLSDLASGHTAVAGTLNASATGAAGKGGFVETSGAHVAIDPSTRVNTLGNAAPGLWLIDPTDFAIVPGSGGLTTSSIGAETLQTNLATTPMVISTAAYGGGLGDINVDAPVVWNSANSLTLTAHRSIFVNSSLSNSGTGDIILNAGWDGFSSVTSPFVSGAGGVSVNAPLVTGGNIFLKSADGGILVNSSLTAGGNVGLDVVSTTGNLAFTASGSVNSGGTLDLIGPNMGLASAAFLRANDINIEGYRGNSLGDVILGATGTGSLGLTQADLSKLELHDPATGKLAILGEDVLLQGPVTLNSAKVRTLHLNGQYGIHQLSTAPLTVQNLRADGGEGVNLDAAANSVSVLAGGSSYSQFHFKNSGNLEIGNVAGASGITSGYTYGSAGVSVQTLSGNLTVSAPVSATSGYSYNQAAIVLSADSGNLIVNSTVSASASGGASVYLNAGGNLTVNAAVNATSADGYEGAMVQLTSGGNTTINDGGSLLADIGCCYYSGNTAEVLINAGGAITLNSGASIMADGYEGNADINLVAAGPVILNAGSSITATGDTCCSSALEAEIHITSTGSNITQNAAITANGGEEGFIALTAGGMIQQTDASGFLKATNSSTYYYGNNSAVHLTAVSGIGDRVNPIRIDVVGDPDVNAINSGTSGHIGLSFFNTSSLMPYHLGTGLGIGEDLANLRNNNPNGIYYVRSDTNIELTIPFRPDGADLLPGQSVVFDAPNGEIYIGQQYLDIDGFLPTGVFGSIRAGAGGTGNVELIAGGKLTIAAGSFVTGREPLIKAGDIDLQGAIRSSGTGFIDIRHITGGPIHLGLSGDGTGGALALDTAELNRMTGWNGVDDPLIPGSAGGLLIGETTGGPLIFKDSVGPTTAFLNVRGSTVTQEAGIISGALSVTAQSGVTLGGSNQISFITGGLNSSGTFSVNSSAPMEVGGIAAPGGNISLSSSGGMTFSGQLNAGAGTVTLSSTNIADNHVGVDIIANSAVINAAYGGSIGSIANPLETSVLNLTVGSTAMGGQEIGVINTGNLTLVGLNFGGSLASIGTTGVLNAGNIYVPTSGVYLGGNAGITLSGKSIYANGLTLDAGSGALQIVGATSVGSAGSLTLKGGSVLIDGSYAYGGNGSTNSTNVVTGGNLHVVNLGQLGTYGSNTNVDAGGSVLVDRSTVIGYPDVNMKVGGTISINGTLVEPGRIAAESPSTINISFPTQSSGGFFVNGVATVFDAATNSGFFVVGDPAVLGSNMFVTYGAASTISPPVDTLIVALTQASKPPAEQQGTGTTSATEEEKDKTVKKGTMVCR